MLNMAHGSLRFSFNFCLCVAIQPTISLDISKKVQSKRYRPPLKLPARKLNGRCFASAYDQGETQFKTAAGVVECNHRGCKPVFDEEDLTTLNGDYDNWVCLENATEILRSRIKAYHEKLSHEEETLAAHSGTEKFYKDFAGYVNNVWMQKDLADKYYEKALEKERSNVELLIEYAEFAWKRLGNREMVDELLEEALPLLESCADNVRAWGMYASLLWQTEE